MADLIVKYSHSVQVHTLTRNAPSLVLFQSEVVSLLELATVLRWWEQSLWEEITSISLRSIRGEFLFHWSLFRLDAQCFYLAKSELLIMNYEWYLGMRNVTPTFQHMFPHVSVWRKEIMSPLVSAGKKSKSFSISKLCLEMFHSSWSEEYLLPMYRPLSKTVRFNVLKVIPAGSSAGGKKAFTGLWF